MKLSAKKIFKEKHTIKGELEKALQNKIPVNASSIAKIVGISVYRVRKYCKSHNIDLNNYTLESINQKVIKEVDSTKKKKVRKIDLDKPTNNKIKLSAPKIIKIKLEEE